MKVVISQSMLFPWVGLLEQIRLADVFVHYDDVQFSKGSFVNRVQIKTECGSKWMTIPLSGHKLGQAIQDVQTAPIGQYRDRHLQLLKQSFAKSPFADDALDIVAQVYGNQTTSLGELARHSMLAVSDYFGLNADTRFLDVSELQIPGSSSQRVFEVVQKLGGSAYITGHGAARYLDHQLFEQSGIDVQYMRYECREYVQPHGPFTPYVSSLDLIANCGPSGIDFICSGVTGWKEFISEQARRISA